MHAQERESRIAGPGPVVEHVPGSVDAVVIDRGDETGPARFETDQPPRRESGRFGVVHQRSSMTPALRPEPMPMQTTESPATSVSCTWARVIGIAAGPMLP